MAVFGCSELLNSLKQEAAAKSADLFGDCGGLTYEQCAGVLAKHAGSSWRNAVRAKMQEVHLTQGDEGTRLLMLCLASGVDTMTLKQYGVDFWRETFNADRPDSAGTTPVIPRPLLPKHFAVDPSRQPSPLPQIDPYMLSCHTRGGTWEPASGKCILPSEQLPPEDEVAVESDLVGECAAAGGTWDPVSMTCQMPAPPGLLSGEKAGLLLAVGGLGIVALTGVGVYLATRK
jgi:hypothetical protein